MRIYKTVKGRLKSIGLDSLPTKEVVWMRAISPKESELEKLASISQIPLEEFRESLEEDERPRLVRKKYLELIYNAPHLFDEKILTMSVYFYVIGNLIITIEEEANSVLDRMEKKGKRNAFFLKSPGKFLYYVLDAINDEYLTFIERIARNLETLKRPDKRSRIMDLYHTNITSAYFNQSIIANLEVLNHLRKSHFPTFTVTDRQNFTELYYDKLQILDTEKIQRELIMNMIDIQSIVSTDRLNTTMKRLTALAIIIAIPTLISGIYGMNLPLPYSDSPHAFGVIMGGMLGAIVFAGVLMKHADWL
ncbi:MAG: magnesium transporter CorA family protein [Nanobdellota archaeon]